MLVERWARDQVWMMLADTEVLQDPDRGERFPIRSAGNLSERTLSRDIEGVVSKERGSSSFIKL